MRDAYIKDTLLRGVAELGADPSEGTFDNWFPQADLCSFGSFGIHFWKGVSCDDPPIAGRGLNVVVTFAIPLKGRLPSSWGALGGDLGSISIEFIDKMPNLTTGTRGVLTNRTCQLANPYVPDTWSNLTNFRSVRLVNLGLQGPVPLHIFAGLRHLFNIDLARNRFTALPAPQVGQFNELYGLWISRNMLAARLPELHEGSLPRLTFLDLSHNMLTGDVPASYGATLKKLTYLCLESNMLDKLVIGPDSFPRLDKLRMAHNQLAGQMPNVLLLQNLRLADLSHNSLTALPDVWWHNMPTDRHIYMKNSYIQVIAPHNKISGSLPPLVSMAGANRTMWLSADLSFNELSGSISASVRKAGTSRQGYLIASHNKLSGSLPPNLMHWFRGAVDLSYNMLSGPCCPEKWHRWDSLHGLYLEHNMLHGPLPTIYSNWSGLVVLDLASNPLNTTIPPVFFGTHPHKTPIDFYGNRQLFVNNCSLHGTLPTAWMSAFLTEGRALAINNNPDLAGCLPPATKPPWPDGCNPAPKGFCNALALVSRNTSCYSCFKMSDIETLQYRGFYGYMVTGYECGQLDVSYELDYDVWVLDQMCDMWLRWPSSTGSADSACSGDWCAALSDTRVTGVCQP